MVDFTKRLTGQKTEKPVDPVKLYDTLDRAADKGPLRPAQEAVLADWFNKHFQDLETIVKLHTGQGKTLIGLLMLQAHLNNGSGPALYICPNNFLIEQTCEQAKQFGIATCQADGELPQDFLHSEKILVASVQKLFNGLTKFGLGNKSITVGTLLMDDAHACVDTIREACRIRIESDNSAYGLLRTLFATDLEQQGHGTFADLCNGKGDAILPVPYWAWIERESEIARILSKCSDKKSVKFAWPLLKDHLRFCKCVFSGTALEIEPYLPPLEQFGSYAKAKHRIFMSATVTDDAFLIKGLQLKPETILNPLSYQAEGWSGEKMVLLPSLMHDDLTHEFVVRSYAPKGSKRTFGRVALVPSFYKATDWEKRGAIVAKTDTVADLIQSLRKGDYENTLVLANRYDGIDLPDNTCRVLIFDGKPFSESLIDLHEESCRSRSSTTLMRTLRTVEQGMGRSVRGEKDYSVIIIVGSDITRLVRDKDSRKLLSPQTATQIEIGMQIAEMAQAEIENGTRAPEEAFNDLIRQCIQRDEGWKSFYVEQMAGVTRTGANERILRIYAAEFKAEQAYQAGDYNAAAKAIQNSLDQGTFEKQDQGWYLQEKARYFYQGNRAESKRLQIAAHNADRLLLKQPDGVTVTKLTLVSQGRMERINGWASKLENYDQLDVQLSDILGRLVFGVKADKFEQALNELSEVIGFMGERPDKAWKEGPDNLWVLDDRQYILWECKNEVDVSRTEIHKTEVEQMNSSSSWFDKHYKGLNVKRILIHPSNTVTSAASFTHDVEVMREADLRRFVKRVRDFFKSFEVLKFSDLSTTHTQNLVDMHGLSIVSLLSDFSKKPKSLK
jgi:replicative superfamily II helicase